MQNTSQEQTLVQPAQGLKTISNVGFHAWEESQTRKMKGIQSPRAIFSYHKQRFSRLEDKSENKSLLSSYLHFTIVTQVSLIFILPLGQKRTGNFYSVAQETQEEKRGANCFCLKRSFHGLPSEKTIQRPRVSQPQMLSKP